MATLEQVEVLLTDLNARLEQTHGLDETQVRGIFSDMLAAQAQANGDLFGKIIQARGGEDRLIGSKFRRYGYDQGDVEFLYDLMTTSQVRGLSRGPSEQLANAFKAVSDAYYLSDEEIRTIDRHALDDVFARVPKSGRVNRLFGRQERYDQQGYDAAVRAMDTAESGYGSQLVGAQYVGDLWEAARPESRIFSLLNTFEMTAPTAYLPIEADVPAMLFVTESATSSASNYTTSKTGSNRATVTAKKFVIHQMWSGEMEEDAILPFVPFLRRQLAISIAHYSDALVINGDDTNAATGNINLDDADPADTSYYLAFDGIRHAAIVDNTANAVSQTSLGIDDFVALKNLMEQSATYAPMHWGYPTDMNDLVFTSDFGTYSKAIQLTQVITLEQYGPGATILTGELGRVFGHPYIPSQAVPKTEADGKVSTVGASNTLGQLVAFNRRGFVVGWRRRVKLETERLPATDQTRIVASLRLGLGRYSPTGAASGIEAAAVGINITIV